MSGKCSAHECPNEPLVRFELIMNDEERVMASAMSLDTKPIYCVVHTVAAEKNPTMKMIGPI